MSKTKRMITLVVLACALPLTGCSTTNLARWGFDSESVYKEPDGPVSAGFVKPAATFVGLPVAFAWDVATFPFQVIFGVYPYGDRFMQPDAELEL